MTAPALLTPRPDLRSSRASSLLKVHLFGIALPLTNCRAPGSWPTRSGLAPRTARGRGLSLVVHVQYRIEQTPKRIGASG